MHDHEVISAFLDHEPFDPKALDAALADPAGRALLIDLIALRTLTQADEQLGREAVAPRRGGIAVRFTVAAAAVLLALFAGYQLGQRPATAVATPPTPTAFVDAGPAWHDIPNGGLQ